MIPRYLATLTATTLALNAHGLAAEPDPAATDAASEPTTTMSLHVTTDDGTHFDLTADLSHVIGAEFDGEFVFEGTMIDASGAGASVIIRTAPRFLESTSPNWFVAGNDPDDAAYVVFDDNFNILQSHLIEGDDDAVASSSVTLIGETETRASFIGDRGPLAAALGVSPDRPNAAVLQLAAHMTAMIAGVVDDDTADTLDSAKECLELAIQACGKNCQSSEETRNCIESFEYSADGGCSFDCEPRSVCCADDDDD